MPLGIDFTQVLLHLFNTVILFAGLYILLYAPVKKFMDEREAKYKKRESETEENLKKSEELKTEYDERLKKAESEIAMMHREAAEQIAEDRRRAEDRAREEARHIIDAARKEGVREREQIVSGAKEDISNMIEEATRKVVFGEGDKDPYVDFVEDEERSAANGK